MLPDQVVCLAAQVHKLMEATGRFVSPVDDVRHVRGENKGGAVSAQVTHHGHRQMLAPTWKHSCGAGVWLLSPFDVPKHLCVSQELPKVNVEHVPAVLQHDVVIVAVTDSKDVGGNTATSTGVDEVFHCLKTPHMFLMKAPPPGSRSTYVHTLSYCSSVGLCFCSQSARGRSLKDPVTPCSTWIFLRVSA